MAVQRDASSADFRTDHDDAVQGQDRHDVPGAGEAMTDYNAGYAQASTSACRAPSGKPGR